ncbi:MAG: SRPBCC family protein [Actinomycetota bacterium]|nr:SRPBCC family protein [Actinomycetota bacterium]
MDRGTYVELDGRPAVRFQRTYPHSVGRLWAAVTEPDELSHWFPSGVRIQQQAGGTVEFSGDPHLEDSTGRILVFDPPRRLAYTWGDDELRFELEPAGDGSCTLTLINVLEARNTAARNAAGWTVCLDELDKHLSGELSDGPHSEANTESGQRYYDAYLADGMPSGAEIPVAQDRST